MANLRTPAIPNINVTDPTLRLILQAMRERIEKLGLETGGTIGPQGEQGPRGFNGADGLEGPPGPPGGGGGVPYHILAMEVYTIPDRQQVLYAVPILIDGVITIIGILREVS